MEKNSETAEYVATPASRESEEASKKYADAVFCFADNVSVKGHATYSVSPITAN